LWGTTESTALASSRPSYIITSPIEIIDIIR
jgi:hypothetical protein